MISSSFDFDLLLDPFFNSSRSFPFFVSPIETNSFRRLNSAFKSSSILGMAYQFKYNSLETPINNKHFKKRSYLRSRKKSYIP